MDDFAKALVAAIIGGLMVMAGQFIQDRRKAAEEKKKRKEDRLLELIYAIYEHNHWLPTQSRLMAQGSHDKLVVTPFSRIQGLTQIYFRQFLPLVGKLALAGEQYQNWLLNNSEHIGGVTLPDNLADERRTMYRNYISCSDALMNEIQKYAKHEFGLQVVKYEIEAGTRFPA